MIMFRLSLCFFKLLFMSSNIMQGILALLLYIHCLSQFKKIVLGTTLGFRSHLAILKMKYSLNIAFF